MIVTPATSPVIIIGAGLAGWTTAREFRKLDGTTPVTMITADSGDFYAKPSLSNAFAQGRVPAQLVSTPAVRMADTLKVTLLAHTEVQAIHPANKKITTSQGELGYSQLVLATGAKPIRVAVGGDASDQIRSINSLTEFSAFHARLTGSGRKVKHVLIMGAGLIGCEFANDLVGSGYDVTVVDPSPAPIAVLLPRQVSEQLRAALTALGVTWHFGVTVKEVRGAMDNQQPINPDSTVTPMQVELSNGHLVHADLVLSAVGLKADTTLAEAAGLICDRGVLVDTTLQTSASFIYALGDAAQYAAGSWDADGAVTGGRTLPYVLPAMGAARALAATLAGKPSKVVFPLMPIVIKTPALPIVVAAPATGTPGEWRNRETDLWQFLDQQEKVRGFVLTGNQTIRRAEQAKLTIA